MTKFKDQPIFIQKLIDGLLNQGIAFEYDETNENLHTKPNDIKIPILNKIGVLKMVEVDRASELEHSLALDVNIKELQEFIHNSIEGLTDTKTGNSESKSTVLNRYFNAKKMENKVFIQSLATYNLIRCVIDRFGWYDHIIDYSEINFWSFGMPETGYDQYLDAVIYILERSKIKDEQMDALVQAFKNKRHRTFDESTRHLELKMSMFETWWKSIPELEYLKAFKETYDEQKNEFRKVGIIAFGKANRFWHPLDADRSIQTEFQAQLVGLTQLLTSQINLRELYKNHQLNNIKDIEKELILAHNEKQSKISKESELTSTTLVYEKLWKKWLEEERKFLSDIERLITNDNKPLPEKTTQIIEGLSEYGFSEYLITNSFKPEDIYQLLSKHSGREQFPYCIALFYEIGYIKYFINELHNGHKKNSFIAMAGIFDGDDRRVRGNVNMLINKDCKENPIEFTSQNYIQIVQKELEGLK